MAFESLEDSLSTYKVNTDNQLSLTTAVALDFSSVSGIRSDRHVPPRLWSRRRISCSSSIARGTWLAAGRRTAAEGKRRRVTGDRPARVDGRRTADHLGGRRPSRTLLGEGTLSADWRRRTGRIVGRVAGRSWATSWVIHREALLGRIGSDGRSGTRAGRKRMRYLRGTQRWRGLAVRYVAGIIILLDAGGRSALSKTKAFQARVHRAHRGKRVLKGERTWLGVGGMSGRGRDHQEKRKRSSRAGRAWEQMAAWCNL